MKKINYSLCFLAGMLLCSFVMVACSSDDDDDNDDNGGSANSSKRIAEIIEFSDGEMIEKTYTYDAQGRIVLIKKVETYYGKEDPGEVTYQYDKNSIQCHSEDGYSVDDHIYTLANGLIVEEFYKSVSRNGIIAYTILYSYDKDGHLISIVDNDEEASTSNYDIVWKDGYITSFGESDFTYTDIPWNKNLIFALDDYFLDPNLMLRGYFGKLPKHMPLTIGYYKYDYTLGPDGLISKITRSGYPRSEQSITWE